MAFKSDSGILFVGNCFVFTSSKYSIEFTYSDFPCHLKVNKDNLRCLIVDGSVKRVKVDHYH